MLTYLAYIFFSVLKTEKPTLIYKRLLYISTLL